MPSLNWIGREAVINHHNDVPYRLLRCDSALSAGEDDTSNLLIEGDNLEALKALLPYYAGQVKCIYIDPPYNTGNENWVYNDRVDSPQMRAWLDRVVGTDDLSRHDKWLCMMYPRLRLLWELLSSDGSLWMSIDDNEVHHARAVLDEIFGAQNFVAMLTWQKRASPANDAKHFSSDHEYILVYAASKATWRPNRLERTGEQSKNYTNPDNDPRGPWNSVTYTGPKSIAERPNLYYGILNPSTGELIFPKRTAVWKYDQETHQQHVRDDIIYWGVKGTNRMPRLKRFLQDVGKVVPRSILMYSDCGHTSEARTEILRVISEVPFTTLKPTRLIRHIIQMATNPGDLVLDSFAGSGTTGHAVLKMNRENGGQRRFILVELESSIARTITAERLRRVVHGYAWTDSQGAQHQEEGQGGRFCYCTLGPTLFDETGSIRSEVTFQDLAAHVYFTETNQPIPGQATTDSPFIGQAGGTAYYLFFNGVRGGSRLNPDTLRQIADHNGPIIAYADVLDVSAAILQQRSITFKHIPYQLTR